MSIGSRLKERFLQDDCLNTFFLKYHQIEKSMYINCIIHRQRVLGYPLGKFPPASSPSGEPLSHIFTWFLQDYFLRMYLKWRNLIWRTAENLKFGGNLIWQMAEKNNYERDCFAPKSCIINIFCGLNILFYIYFIC